MSDTASGSPRKGWRSFLRRRTPGDHGSFGDAPNKEKWSMGILNDKSTIEVPGSVLLLASDRNEPLGLRNAPARTSASSIPISIPVAVPEPPEEDTKKKTSDGKIILEPQPEDSANDPLNWPTWKRDSSLVSLGLYCMVGGGMTTILAAGFTDVSEEYDVDVADVSLTVGLYMMGLGLGSVIFSPTAILYGKRPVYLFSSVLFILTSVWCALSPNFISLILARIFQGISVSPVECLPSATIAEIFFLHERAYRIGIYTLLLLGGKNLIPLVSAAIIQRLGWRWVFWIVALVVGFCGILLFLFVPETFWDRTPVRKPKKASRPNFFRRLSSRYDVPPAPIPPVRVPSPDGDQEALASPDGPQQRTVEFASELESEHSVAEKADVQSTTEHSHSSPESQDRRDASPRPDSQPPGVGALPPSPNHPARDDGPDGATATDRGRENPRGPVPEPALPDETHAATNISPQTHMTRGLDVPDPDALSPGRRVTYVGDTDSERQSLSLSIPSGGFGYTAALRDQPAQSFTHQLKPFHGRLHRDKWWKVAIRPLILFMYPAVLWSSVVYACSVGWLIVISESVAVIYRNPDSYNFDALQTGLIFISPLVGGIFGTAVAGKVSDVVVKHMARRNGGLYEPEFRLTMAVPITLSTVVGLMAFGWSAEERNNWIVPTVFMGVVSFGCLLGSTTSITFCVDSYRQYAGEALVTLNFSKNIFHGLVFSLFVTGWITSDGSKTVFIWLGVIQLILMAFTIPMYIYGKRARMWTVRKNFMEKF